MKDLLRFLLAFAVPWIDVLAPMALLALHGRVQAAAARRLMVKPLPRPLAAR
jgi:hypothetical protein